MKIFAHRGLSSKYPENTVCAFKEALKYDIQGVETDVQLSKDGEMMIFHDEILERTTGCKGFLKDLTFTELRKLNANNGYEGNYPIPTLDEFLDVFKDYPNVIVNLELKTSVFEYLGIEEKVYECIKCHNMIDQIIISSFNHETLVRMKEIDPNVKTGVLTGDRIFNAEEYCKSLKADFYQPFFAVIKPERVKLAHDLGIGVNVWTVDEPMYVEMMRQCDVDVVMTNCCDKFCKKV